MKKYLLLLFIPLSFLLSFKNKGFTPPGTVQINDTLWYDQTEVSNFAYIEYVQWTGKTYGYDSQQYKKALPDTLVWRDKLSFNEPYMEYYFRHPAYKMYPVVGVNYYQANDYCKWRTERVKEFLKMAKTKKTYVFEYRLPTKEEWQSVALLGWNKKTKQLMQQGKIDSRTPYNFKIAAGDKIMIAGTVVNEGADVTRPVFAGAANEKEMYNLFGNVAEMTAQKGECVGGGWIHGVEESGYYKTKEYSGGKSWLGFRCVCVVKNP
jgi:formylglycine-generating enzyme required for sulfatase activity